MTIEEAMAQARRHHDSGQLESAERLYRQVLAVQPENADALHLLGRIAIQCGANEAAIGLVRDAINVRPNDPDVHYSLGVAQRHAGQIEQAIQTFRQLLATWPNHGDAHNGLGDALQAAGDIEGAIQAYRHATSLLPRSPEAHNNLGSALQEAGQIEQAISEFRAALNFAPDHAAIHYNLSLALLLSGDLPAGFAEHRWRWKVPQLGLTHRSFPQPQWDGSAPSGTRILIYCEQGFGDSIQFMRYVPIIAQRGAHVILQLPAELVNLAQTLAGSPQIVRFGDPLPEFDAHVAMLDLPLVIGATLQSIPTAPYFSATPADTEHWRTRIAQVSTGKPKVGIAWAGRPEHRNDRNRSIPFAEIESLLQNNSAQFFSLQLNAPANPELTEWTSELHDFSASAGLIANLDLIISVDTSVAHLAGAMGKPVWLLLPFAPDWRWLIKRSDSPWYPTMRIFRQARAGGWSAVLREVGASLSLLSQ